MEALQQNRTAESDQVSGTMPTADRPRIRLADLEYRLFNPRNALGAAFDQAYQLWRDVWTDTLTELDGIKQLHSDEFTRQDEVGVLIQGGSCVSVTGVRWLDMSRQTSIEDSYFRDWPKECIQRIGAARLGISSNTVVSPTWRGALVEAPDASGPAAPMRLNQLTIGMSLRRFADSPASLFVGVARNNRGMHRVAENLGAERIATIPVHRIDSDIMLWTQEDVANLGPLVGALWDRRSRG